MKEEPSLPAHTVFVPQDLSKFDQQHPLPVLVWGNGACTNSPWEHFKFLNEIASHGYIVVATGYIPMKEEPYHGPMSTTQQQIESIDWVIAQNADPTSPYYQKIDVKKMTDEEANELIQKQFAASEAQIAVDKEFLPKFLEILTPVETAQVFVRRLSMRSMMGGMGGNMMRGGGMPRGGFGGGMPMGGPMQ
jgi:hypothetical protein